MNTIQALLMINDTVLRVGDKVKVNSNNDINNIAVYSVFRRWYVSEKTIELWFSKNNFSAQSYRDENYDVIVHYIWLDNINECLRKMNLQIIK